MLARFPKARLSRSSVQFGYKRKKSSKEGSRQPVGGFEYGVGAARDETEEHPRDPADRPPRAARGGSLCSRSGTIRLGSMRPHPRPLVSSSSSPSSLFLFNIHHFSRSLPSIVSLVRPAVLMGMCGAAGTWQMVQGHGSPAQCWKPGPSCRDGGATAELFISAWGARMDVSPGSELDSVEDVEVVSALPRRGCTWCT
ncbi:hypothetical protein EYF80_015492 [Liparis tanakae]|uniref:Uncharacterized protein n=1 Tax=Liparis tanakae TaxID=230148 RepID=A0A4Z2I860_9TELE|nr:hypothetical protein EYF80_015492 [Liparis tanakae]